MWKKPLRFVDLVVEKLQKLVDLCVLIFVGSCKPTGLEFSAWRWRRTLKYISNKRTRNNNNSVQEILFESQPFLKRRIDDHFWRFRGVFIRARKEKLCELFLAILISDFSATIQFFYQYGPFLGTTNFQQKCTTFLHPRTLLSWSLFLAICSMLKNENPLFCVCFKICQKNIIH